MAWHRYHIVSRWRVRGTPEEVYEVLDDPAELPRWWPAVYLDVKELERGDPRGIGRSFRLLTKGWLPYRLNWTLRTLEKERPRRIVIEATGDFTGRGTWTITPDGPWVDALFDWDVRAEKRLLRWFSFLLRPAFAANHHWAMARGRESLELELARRLAPTPEARAKVAPPPGPTTVSSLTLLLGLAGTGVVLGAAVFAMVKLLGSG
jgi:hypothetical protein